jgi:hypothetical protein
VTCPELGGAEHFANAIEEMAAIFANATPLSVRSRRIVWKNSIFRLDHNLNRHRRP